jgi:hypothetical protein
MKIQKTVMQYAWSVNHLFTNFAEALRKAWAIVKLKRDMSHGEVRFKFRKVNGEIREAVGTLNVEYERKGTGYSTEETVSFFDMIANGWRSFKVTQLIQ